MGAARCCSRLAEPRGRSAQEDKQAQQDNPLHTATRVELDVAKVVLAQEKAWNRGDLEGYAKGYKDSPETLLLGRQVLKGYAQILEDYKHNYPTAGVDGDAGVLRAGGASAERELRHLHRQVSIWSARRKRAAPADGMFSLVLEKTGEGWKIVLDHTT